jgi:hypothetical protein
LSDDDRDPVSGCGNAQPGDGTRDGGAGAGALGDSLAKPELATKFHDNALRSLPEERAAEIAARTLALPDAQSVEDLTALLTSAGER